MDLNPSGLRHDEGDSLGCIHDHLVAETQQLPGAIQVAVNDGQVDVTRPDDERQSRALHGLTRSLISNMVEGVTKGFVRNLDIVGVVYRAVSQSPSSIELMLGIDPATIDVVANGGSKPNNAMLAWARELELGSWFTLDHNGRVVKVQFAWRSDRKQLNLFASVDGHSYLIQVGRLAAYLQAGLLLPQEEETLTVRATRDALAKLEANPERLLG